MDAICPIKTNGCSTGCPPIHVKMSASATNNQNVSWDSGRYAMVRCFDRWRIGRKNKIKIDAINASTPPSLFGIERRIA